MKTAISTDANSGSDRLQAGGQISYAEYLGCAPDQIEPDKDAPAIITFEDAHKHKEQLDGKQDHPAATR